MSGRSIKDHPFYVRMQQVPPEEVAAWVLGELPIEKANKTQRKEAFRRVAKHITSGKAERTKYGFNSDTNGEIARAMEWTFQAGIRLASSDETKTKKSSMRSRAYLPSSTDKP